MSSFLRVLARGAAEDYHLHNERTGQPVATSLLKAFDSKARRTGLLRHTALADGTAMIIAPTSAIHTFFMRFAIDVAFVSKDGRILKIRSALRPWRIVWAVGAHGVVELPAGALERADSRVGDRLAIVPR
jgi:uncharacterized membrane protein (UPF0127 family)